MTLANPEIESLLQELLADLRAPLGERLVGVYLFGSLVWGDFDPQISDIDLMVAVAEDITAEQLPALAGMHAAFEARHPFWEGRIEAGYISPQSIGAYGCEEVSIAVLSPGEPLNIKPAGTDWFINWYVIQEKGVQLYGPPPQTLIPPISKDAFRRAVKQQTAEWREWVVHTRDSRPYQGYAILTMVRALYAVQTGEQPSKLQAARWAASEHPELGIQIEKALQWRDEWRNKTVDPGLTYPETEAFVREMVDRIVGSGGEV